MSRYDELRIEAAIIEKNFKKEIRGMLDDIKDITEQALKDGTLDIEEYLQDIDSQVQQINKLLDARTAWQSRDDH